MMQLYVCKRSMCVKHDASTAVVLGDCGRLPLFIEITRRRLRHWVKSLKIGNRFLKKCYKALLYQDAAGIKTWVSRLRLRMVWLCLGQRWANMKKSLSFFLIKIDCWQQNEYTSIQTLHSHLTSSSNAACYINLEWAFQYDSDADPLDLNKFCSRVFISADLHLVWGGCITLLTDFSRMCVLCDSQTTENGFYFSGIFIYGDVKKIIPQKYPFPNIH